MKSKEIVDSINEYGFYDKVQIELGAIELIKNFITYQYAKRVCLYTGCNDHELGHSKNLSNYHSQEYSKDHIFLWPHSERILPPHIVSVLKKFPSFKNLMRDISSVKIRHALNAGVEEPFWRIVRPNYASDIGSLHADSWFDLINDKQYPISMTSLKLWMPIESEPGKNGFKYIPKSHKTKYKFKAVQKQGTLKPQIVSFDESKVEQFFAVPGNAILFHDDLIHGGFIGGNNTRVSLEMGFWVPKNLIMSFVEYKKNDVL